MASDQVYSFYANLANRACRKSMMSIARNEDDSTYPFVTISRQAGAGGHSLAETLMRHMELESDKDLFREWKIWDKEISEKISRDPDLKVTLQSLLDQEMRPEREDIFSKFADTTPQWIVLRKMFALLWGLANSGKALIVGRGAASLTASLHKGVHIRLVASHSSRLARLQKKFNLSEEAADKMLKRQDRSRKQLVYTFFNKDIDDPLLYDTVWNTDTVSLDTIAQGVIQLIKTRQYGSKSGISHEVIQGHRNDEANT